MSEPLIKPNALLDILRKNEQRLSITESKEVPGGIPGFTSFYDTGLWTPTLVGLTIAGTFTYTALTAGNYTRIGNMVMIWGRIQLTAVAVAPTGNLSIQGLPFTPASGQANGTAGLINFAYWSTFGLGGGAFTHLGGWIQSGTARIDLLRAKNDGTAGAFLTGAVAAVAANTDMLFSGQYQV